MDPGFNLIQWLPPRETKPEGPLIASPQTHLNLSFREKSVKYTDIKGCYHLFKWAMGTKLFVSTGGGGGESLVSPHSSGQPKIPSPRNVYMLVKSK